MKFNISLTKNALSYRTNALLPFIQLLLVCAGLRPIMFTCIFIVRKLLINFLLESTVSFVLVSVRISFGSTRRTYMKTKQLSQNALPQLNIFTYNLDEKCKSYVCVLQLHFIFELTSTNMRFADKVNKKKVQLLKSSKDQMYSSAQSTPSISVQESKENQRSSDV